MKKQMCAAAFFLGLVGGLSLFAITRQPVEASIPPQRLITIPPVISAVDGLEITNVRVVDGVFGDPVLELDIQNNTSREAIAVFVDSGGSGQGRSGTLEIPMLAPYGTLTMTFQVANLRPGKPLALSAVVWKDGHRADPLFTRSISRKR